MMDADDGPDDVDPADVELDVVVDELDDVHVIDMNFVPSGDGKHALLAGGHGFDEATTAVVINVVH
jgi:hypothetical protein